MLSVLIVGAGPAGLVAALTLLRNGVDVRIIDKEGKYNMGQRGAAIVPRSRELYRFLEVEEIEKYATPSLLVRYYEADGVTPMKTYSMFTPVELSPAFPYNDFSIMGQEITESHLRSQIAKYSCQVELGTQLRSLEQHPGHVTATIVRTQGGEEIEETIQVMWVIGADGGKGITRKLLNLDFIGETRNDDCMLVGDIQLKGLDREHWHMWGDMFTKYLYLRPTPELGDDGFALFATARDCDPYQLCVDKEALFEYLASITKTPTLTFTDVRWMSEFRSNIRMTNTFQQGRVFLTGDAAHCHSPAGAQGMNSSIQDSFNLGWKLALVIKGLAPLSLLDSYSEERVPVIAEMLNLTTRLLDAHTKVQGQDLADSWKRGAKFLQLGVNYRTSRIVVDERPTVKEYDPYSLTLGGQLRAGDRAPNAPDLLDTQSPGAKRELFDIFRPVYHTVMIFAEDEGYVNDVTNALKICPQGTVYSIWIRRHGSLHSSLENTVDLQLEDSNGHAYTAYSCNQGELATIVIVRPDGVVGAIVFDSSGIPKYFSRVLLIE